MTPTRAKHTRFATMFSFSSVAGNVRGSRLESPSAATAGAVARRCFCLLWPGRLLALDHHGLQGQLVPHLFHDGEGLVTDLDVLDLAGFLVQMHLGGTHG